MYRSHYNITSNGNSVAALFCEVESHLGFDQTLEYSSVGYICFIQKLFEIIKTIIVTSLSWHTSLVILLMIGAFPFKTTLCISTSDKNFGLFLLADI